MSQLEEFKALGLSDDILTAISKKGFETPSAIQSLTIPHLLNTDKDIIAQAQTGTGKTAAFGLPIIQLLTGKKSIPQALVLVPTRELALQVTQELQSFNSNELSIAPIYGGASIEEQLRRLKKGIDIVVGTPGRILDHIRRRTLNLSELSYLVLDEADEMLNMGFIEDIEDIMREMPETKRVLLFSATMPDRIASLAKNYMNKPDILKVEAKNVTADLTTQIYFEVREGDKLDALTRIIDVESDFYGIVFSRTKVGVDELVNRLTERGYSAEGLHGDISQAQREKILGKFKKKHSNILIATDVAARGIDINNLTHVINYSLPQDSESYVHRIGRTGRAGNQGTAITFISPSEMRQFGFLKRDIKADIKLEKLPTPADVIAMKRNRIKEDLYSIVESENYSECETMAAELLEMYTPEVALSALLRLAFKDELSENSYPEIRSINVDRKGKARIFIAVGFKDGYDPRKLVKLLKRECGLNDHNIDDITVSQDFSFATVPFDQANKVVQALNQLSKGRPIAEIAKERDGEGGGRGHSAKVKREQRGDAGDRPARKPRTLDSKAEGKPEWKKDKKSDGRFEDKPARNNTGYGRFEEKPVRKKKAEDNDSPKVSKGADKTLWPSDDWFAEFVDDKPASKKKKAAVSGNWSDKKSTAKKPAPKTSRREKKEKGRRK